MSKRKQVRQYSRNIKGQTKWYTFITNNTFPETNSSRLKMDGWNTVTFLSGRPILRCYMLVSGSVLQAKSASATRWWVGHPGCQLRWKNIFFKPERTTYLNWYRISFTLVFRGDLFILAKHNMNFPGHNAISLFSYLLFCLQVGGVVGPLPSLAASRWCFYGYVVRFLCCGTRSALVVVPWPFFFCRFFFSFFVVPMAAWCFFGGWTKNTTVGIGDEMAAWLGLIVQMELKDLALKGNQVV